MKSMYLRLGLALLISLAVMFVLSLAQVHVWGDFYLNLSNFYISLTMVGAMGIVMLLVMWPMYENKRLNVALLTGFVAMLVGAFALARTETFVDDDAFLSSMIPHHSRAILVCQESSLTDPEIIELCDSIVRSQQQEIDQMKDIIERRSNP
ncbi:DUF305 domain-containing protein [Promicromonospora xylanilytica]